MAAPELISNNKPDKKRIVPPLTPPTPAPIPVEKTPKKRGRKQKEVMEAKPVEQPKPVFPAKGKINAYGFLHFSQGVMEAMELEKGVDYPVKILGYKDGILTVGLELATTV